MNAQQIIERLDVHGCKLSFIDDTVVTDRGDPGQHSGLKKVNDEWLIYSMERGCVTEGKRFSEFEDACFTFFMQRMSSLSLQTELNRYIFIKPNILHARNRADVEMCLEHAAYPHNLYAFDKESGKKNYIYFVGTELPNAKSFYIGNNSILPLHLNRWASPYSLWSLEIMLKEEQVLLDKGYIKERLTDREMADFILGRY